ncbi:hypothetical protein RO3G_14570 [Rhizopus delemar RA 99-880]|uniref:Uncharacterized protein n=1 Tax=Rhizopus delemar (strain RA 99-880 / ATCC MYA-4621 / FGSC 9543 / NRRL 43880) TaxID=246409 RepID=I1CN29_RHIO9|nr:hypothetical protein RO3G_14570 [Rhizopus delemar RA 99-880]|eukprot:EIE89859.1 hypothetical protein RO3G_14570 [Rhizopus delemar RA 99-880]
MIEVSESKKIRKKVYTIANARDTEEHIKVSGIPRGDTNNKNINNYYFIAKNRHSP